MAGAGEDAKRYDAAGGVVDAAERAGRIASAAAKELAAALAGSLKHFLRLLYEKHSPSLQR
jgi:hypothetical protein